MTAKAFEEFDAAVKESYFDHSRISFIYKRIENYCWRSSQVATLVKRLSSEDEQLKLAKYAYKYTYDIVSYDVVANALSTARKRVELREWLESIKPSNSGPINPKPLPIPENRYCKGRSLNDTEFSEALASIQKIAFEDTKKAQVLAVAKNACLSIDQVRKLIGAFTFEENKLEIAKSLYTATDQRDKYYLLTDAFVFDSNKKELANFINSQPK